MKDNTKGSLIPKKNRPCEFYYVHQGMNFNAIDVFFSRLLEQKPETFPEETEKAFFYEYVHDYLDGHDMEYVAFLAQYFNT